MAGRRGSSSCHPVTPPPITHHPALQERQRPALVRIETGLALVITIEEAQLAALVAEENGGVDVRGSADGARVAKARGHDIDRGDDVCLHRGLALEGAL